MSKFLVSLSYKDCCILKHALRDKVKISQSVMDAVDKAIEGLDESRYTSDKVKKQRKELEEEMRTLERFTEEIECNKENYHMKVR